MKGRLHLENMHLTGTCLHTDVTRSKYATFVFIEKHNEKESGPGSSVGIATDYGLDGPGSNPGGDEIFRPSRPALGPTQRSAQWVPGLSGG